MTTPAISLATAGRRVLALAWLLAVLVASITTGTADGSDRLPVEKVVVTTAQGDVSFEAEIAITDETRSRGLMFRRSMGEREAMLFYWDNPEPISMWMRNTYISLDMLFADADGVVVHVATDTVPHSLDVISAGREVSAVMEVVAGTAAKLGIRPGSRLKHRFFDGS